MYNVKYLMRDFSQKETPWVTWENKDNWHIDDVLSTLPAYVSSDTVLQIIFSDKKTYYVIDKKTNAFMHKHWCWFFSIDFESKSKKIETINDVLWLLSLFPEKQDREILAKNQIKTNFGLNVFNSFLKTKETSNFIGVFPRSWSKASERNKTFFGHLVELNPEDFSIVKKFDYSMFQIEYKYKNKKITTPQIIELILIGCVLFPSKTLFKMFEGNYETDYYQFEVSQILIKYFSTIFSCFDHFEIYHYFQNNKTFL